MKKLTLIFAAMLICFSAAAQQSLQSRAAVKSPEINPDKTVTFRLVAPKAVRVQVTGDFLPAGQNGAQGVADLVETDGVWAYTTEKPLDPELYFYNFLVDGLKINDPNNVHMIRDVANVFNVFLIDGGRADLYKVNDVPHGTVARVWYDSPVVGFDRRLTIYTPPGYEQNPKAKYPVFYLFHGAGGDEEAWIALGRTAQIMDNLIAQGKAEPMIVVMPNGHAGMSAAPGESSMGYYKPYHFRKGTMDGIFEQHFPEIVKFVDKTYRTQADKAHRAIAGLSMGGFHSAFISANYPDLFGYVGLFSAAVGVTDPSVSPIYQDFDAKLANQFKKGVKLYWMGCGNVDFLYKNNKAMREKFDANGYRYVYLETDGGHVWKNWRIYLADFAPRLFK